MSQTVTVQNLPFPHRFSVADLAAEFLCGSQVQNGGRGCFMGTHVSQRKIKR
jgi:hypothetical protein